MKTLFTPLLIFIILFITSENSFSQQDHVFTASECNYSALMSPNANSGINFNLTNIKPENNHIVGSVISTLTVEDLTPKPKYLKPEFTNTGNNCSVIISMNSSDDGKEIGIYSSTGKLIGSSVVDKGKAAVTVWGDDETTDAIDGAQDNELLSAKILDTLSRTLMELTLSNIHDLLNNKDYTDLYYHTNALLSATGKSAGKVPESFSVNVNPNPVFIDKTYINIAIPEKDKVTVDLYSLDGKKVQNIYHETPPMLSSQLTFETGTLTSGGYAMVAIYKGEVISKVMIIIR